MSFGDFPSILAVSDKIISISSSVYSNKNKNNLALSINNIKPLLEPIEGVILEDPYENDSKCINLE